MNFLDHLQRIHDSAKNVFTLANLSGWIEKHTRLEGKPWSFKDHEYQKDIIDDPAKTIYVNKAAQTGLSEIFARWGIACTATQQNFTLIWTFPSTTDAEKFAKTRLDPFIQGSPELVRMISKSVNSAELKQFNENSFVYIRGTLSETGGLSVPADMLIHDELDKSDIDNIATYVSRLQHKPTKVRRLFSTPTVKKYGIDLLCETAQRKRQFWKCSHCNHQFLPSYEENVIIPGWNGTKKEINRNNLKNIQWTEAQLLCPRCFKAPDPSIEFREWVVENPSEHYEAKAYYVSPFCAPAVISMPYLVQASTVFNKWSEFVNQSLGLTAEDDQESLTESDIRRAMIQADLSSSEIHYMGADMGVMCHIAIGRRAHDGTLLCVHREKVPFTRFIDRRRELIMKYKIAVSVHDLYPYSEMITQITNYDPNAYGAIYVERASSETHTIKMQEENPEEGKLNVQTAMINRSVSLDTLMQEFKADKIKIAEQEDFEEFVVHMRDMKRVQKFDKHGGVVYKWEKTQGNDHYHHALHYLMTACNLRGTLQPTTTNTSSLVMSFRIKQK